MKTLLFCFISNKNIASYESLKLSAELVMSQKRKCVRKPLLVTLDKEKLRTL